MRNSCNGCRVLRKGCTDECIIRPCLQWIKSAESQANATLFLAKFYGRAGLMNLLESNSAEVRPDVFKSLLFEACGRNINPINGVLGLLLSDNWDKCQAAVDSVLIKGSPTVTVSPSDASASEPIIPPLKTFDIRHIQKVPTDTSSGKTHKARTHRFKRHAKSASKPSGLGINENGCKFEEGNCSTNGNVSLNRAESNEIELNQTELNLFSSKDDNNDEPDLELSL